MLSMLPLSLQTVNCEKNNLSLKTKNDLEKKYKSIRFTF
jgi:hypothetical protein